MKTFFQFMNENNTIDINVKNAIYMEYYNPKDDNGDELQLKVINPTLKQEESLYKIYIDDVVFNIDYTKFNNKFSKNKSIFNCFEDLAKGFHRSGTEDIPDGGTESDVLEWLFGTDSDNIQNLFEDAFNLIYTGYRYAVYLSDKNNKTDETKARLLYKK